MFLSCSLCVLAVFLDLSEDGQCAAAAITSYEVHRSDHKRASGLWRIWRGLPVLPRHPGPGGVENHVHGPYSERVSSLCAVTAEDGISPFD